MNTEIETDLIPASPLVFRTENTLLPPKCRYLLHLPLIDLMKTKEPVDMGSPSITYPTFVVKLIQMYINKV